MGGPLIALPRHLASEEESAPRMGGLCRLLGHLALAAKILAREIGRAAITGRVGLAGQANPTGDAQKKLDVFANEVVVDTVAESGLVAGIVSEELDEVKWVTCQEKARYLLCTDPLDGSSNTDINAPLGTIFGVYRRPASGRCEGAADLLRKGTEQVAAGYVLYGPSTILVYTSGRGVQGFTLDRDVGEFFLTHEGIRCPARGRTYSANLARLREWHPGIRRSLDALTEKDRGAGRPYSLRYTGALVADIHRTLLEGGLYLYPADADHPEGKLRLLYECAPLSFLVEQAGGRASTGRQRILDISADSIHQRVPLLIGSSEDVALCERSVAAVQ